MNAHAIVNKRAAQVNQTWTTLTTINLKRRPIMADDRLEHCQHSLNLSCPTHVLDSLSENLKKAYALSSAASSLDFILCREDIIGDYLWALNGLLEQAKFALDALQERTTQATI